MKRILLINAHVALLCVGTIVNAVVFTLCWPLLHGLYAAMLYIGVFVMEWVLTLLTQRSGSSWGKKRYNIAHICCYVMLAVVMAIGMVTKPVFHIGETVISPVVDSILFTVTVLLLCGVYSMLMGHLMKSKIGDLHDLSDYYCTHQVYENFF